MKRQRVKINGYLNSPYHKKLLLESEIDFRLPQRPTREEVDAMLDSIRTLINGKEGAENVLSIHKYGIAGMLETFFGDGSMFPAPWDLDLYDYQAENIKGLFDNALMPVCTEIAIEYPILARAGLWQRGAGADAQLCLSRVKPFPSHGCDPGVQPGCFAAV